METTFSELIDNADHDSEFYKIVLFLFYWDAVNKADHTWDDFEEALIYKNRFSSQNDILEELHKKATAATHIIPKGTVLYRARIFDKNIIDIFVKNYVFDPDKAINIDKDSIPKLNLKPKDVLPLIMATNPEAGFETIKRAYAIWKRKNSKDIVILNLVLRQKNMLQQEERIQNVFHIYICAKMKLPLCMKLDLQ